MRSGLRISAGMIVLGVACAGIAPVLSSPGEPIELIGGSALFNAPRPEPTPSGGLIWLLAAYAQERGVSPLQPAGPVLGTQGVPGRIAPPSFSLIEIDPNGRIRFEGHGTPGSRVTLNRHGEPFASAVVTPKGDWSVTLDGQMSSGVHVFSSSAAQPTNGTAIEGGDVRIAIPRELAVPGGTEKGQSHGAVGGNVRQDDVRRRAEDIAGAASEEFSRIQERQISQASPPVDQKGTSAGQEEQEGGSFLFWMQEWLASSNRQFQGKIMRRLQVPSPEAEAAAEVELKRKKEDTAAVEQKAEEARRQAEAAEAQRKAEEARRQAEAAEAQRKAEEARRQAEAAEAQRKAERSAAIAPATNTAKDKLPAAKSPEGTAATSPQDAPPTAARSGTSPYRSASGRPDPRGPDGHVMPEGWRRFADLVQRRQQSEEPAPSHQVSGRSQGDTGSAGVQSAKAIANAMPDGGQGTNTGRNVHTRACPGAGRNIHLPGTYIVRSGDNLWAISRRHYRRGKYWSVIYRANVKRIADPDLIFPCQKVHIPRLRRP